MDTSAELDSIDAARIVVELASELQASDITMIDIGDVSDFADYFVVMTADSSRQINAILRDIEDALKMRGKRLHHREGSPEGGWVLLDFSDIIIHCFQSDVRDFYQIEDVWAKGLQTVRIQ